MKVQFIYTFENAPQVITEYKKLFKVFIISKNVFLSYAMACLGTDEERCSVIKISCSIIGSSIINEPKWYKEISGKFWIDDLEIWRLENSMRSTVSKEFINEFNLANI